MLQNKGMGKCLNPFTFAHLRHRFTPHHQFFLLLSISSERWRRVVLYTELQGAQRNSETSCFLLARSSMFTITYLQTGNFDSRLMPPDFRFVTGKEEERQMFQQMQAMAQKQVVILMLEEA